MCFQYSVIPNDLLYDITELCSVGVLAVAILGYNGQ